MENLRNRIIIKLLNNEKIKKIFKMYIKTKLHVAKIFDKKLVAIRKSKLALNLICIH